MAAYEITAEINLRKIIAESREVAQALNGFADDLERIEKKYSEQQLDAVNAGIPLPKMGRWIDDKCSVCGKGTEDLISSREWYRNEEPNFCPFCGLKLIDSQESEDVERSDKECKL